MTVVLLELAHARHSGQRAGHLVAHEHVEGDVPQRQFTVRVFGPLIQQIVRGAVHRFERRVVLLRLLVEHEEHVLPVFPPMPRDLP